MGPGIMMASAAVGGSHLIASTQAGALYGWQLALVIVLANLFKYPFFRFGPQYTLTTGQTLLEGYAQKSRVYLWIFFIMNLFAAVVNTRRRIHALRRHFGLYPARPMVNERIVGGRIGFFRAPAAGRPLPRG